MEGNEFIVAVVAIIFGTAFGAFVLYMIFSTLKAWINRKKSSIDDEMFDRMAQAFIKHKKDTEQRLENLETIVTDEKDLEAKKIEIDSTEQEIGLQIKEKDKEQPQTKSGSLKNILKE